MPGSGARRNLEAGRWQVGSFAAKSTERHRFYRWARWPCLGARSRRTLEAGRAVAEGARGGFDVQEPRGLCSLGGERIYVAAKNGLFGLMGKRTYWLPLEVGPNALPTADVRSVSLLGQDHIVTATAQGAALSNGLHWRHLKGADGLPIEDITLSAVGPDGTVWFGSEKGVIRWRNGEFTYLAGGRWLPDNRVRALAPATDGSIWV